MVIAHKAKVAILRRALLLTMDRALGAIHIRDDTPVRAAGHGLPHLMGIQLNQSLQALLAGGHLSLETVHRVSAG